MADKDPKKLLIELLDSQSWRDWFILTSGGGGSAVYPSAVQSHPRSAPKTAPMFDTMESEIVAQLRDHVKQSGTLDEFIIDGHGGPAVMSYKGHPISTPLLLNAVIGLQNELNQPVAKKIIFLGCNVFADLPPEYVDFYRRAARQLKAEIIGSMDYTRTSVLGISGSFVKFAPDGSVQKDTAKELSSNILTKSLYVFPRVFLDPILRGRHDTSWFRCHEGKTQDEGAACQKQGKEVKMDEVESGLAFKASSSQFIGH